VKRPINVLELRSVRGTGGGPEKTILQSAARTDPSRFRVVVCYVRDRRDEVFAIDTKAAALGIQYVDVWERHSFDPAVWPALRRLIREHQIDIVHSHDYKTNLLAYLLGKVDEVVPLSTVHGWSGHSAKERYLYYPADQRLLSRFPRLVAVSGQIRSVLVAKGADPRRVSVVLNGIDPHLHVRDRAQEASVRRELAIDSDAQVIGSVGRLEREKRFDLLIDAVGALLSKYPRLRLVVAGAGSQSESIEAYANARLPPGVCRFLGDRNDVIRLHHAFDCYVQSSATEGTSNSVLEAMAMETPVAATDVGGTRELITDQVHGLIVPPNDVNALALAIDRTLSDPVGTAARVSAARRRVEGELSFDHRMQCVESIYEDLAYALPSSLLTPRRSESGSIDMR
jgi:glycosyltransferase involved in cell wall biosynthesis